MQADSDDHDDDNLDNLSLYDFELLDATQDTIGKGSFGVVQKICRKGAPHKVYALKCMRKAEVLEGNLVEQVELEIEVQQKLKHPNVLRLYRHFEDQEMVYLLLEFCAKGELYQIIRTQKNRRFSEPVASMFFVQVSRGLMYLHANNIVHRDIKPENLLVNQNDVLKIADFGWCADYSNQRMTFCGTLDYLAPEMIQGRGHNHTLDIWSAGVLLYEMVVGRPPFHSTNHGHLISKILTLELRFPSFASQGLQDLVEKLLKRDPSERMALQDALVHHWVAGQPSDSFPVSATPEGSFVAPATEANTTLDHSVNEATFAPTPSTASQPVQSQASPQQSLRGGRPLQRGEASGVRHQSAQGLSAKATGTTGPAQRAGGSTTLPVPTANASSADSERAERSRRPGGGAAASAGGTAVPVPRRSPHSSGASGGAIGGSPTASGAERRTRSAMRPPNATGSAVDVPSTPQPAVVYRPLPSSPQQGVRPLRGVDQSASAPRAAYGSAAADSGSCSGRSGRRDREADASRREPSLQQVPSQGALPNGSDGSGGRRITNSAPRPVPTSSQRSGTGAKARSPSAGAGNATESVVQRSPPARHRAVGAEADRPAPPQSPYVGPRRLGAAGGAAPMRGLSSATSATSPAVVPRRTRAEIVPAGYGGQRPVSDPVTRAGVQASVPVSPHLPSRSVQPYNGGAAMYPGVGGSARGFGVHERTV